ncbi:MAG: hypothetical protein U9O94_01390 [Nanoarchaeota archaeon]|nr:hypothetical protein [Nanoarchaeota archaeon]
MADTKETLQKDYDSLEATKEDKKATRALIMAEIRQLETEQILLQERWNKLERDSPSE